MTRTTNYRAGYLAEQLAAALLRLKGYRILARRLRTPVGEIDLLVRRGHTVAVIEVKHRPDLDSAAGAISPRQRKRLCDAARFVLAGKPELRDHSLRFDALLVSRFGWSRHIVNAWSEQ